MKSYKAYRDGQFLSKVDVNPPVRWCITNYREDNSSAK